MRLAVIYIPVWTSLLISTISYAAVYYKAHSILAPFRKASVDSVKPILPQVSIPQNSVSTQISINDESQRPSESGPSLQERKQDDSHEVFHRLMFIPLVFICLRVWGSINRIYEMKNGGLSVAAWLDYAQTIGDTSQGWVNCIFFVMMSKRVRERYKTAVTNGWKSVVFRATGHKGEAQSSSVQVYDHVSVRSSHNPSHILSLQDPLIDPDEDEELSKN